VECLVAELATGQGARLRETGDHMVATAYRVRQLTTLELLMHQKVDHHLGRKSLFAMIQGSLFHQLGNINPHQESRVTSRTQKRSKLQQGWERREARLV